MHGTGTLKQSTFKYRTVVHSGATCPAPAAQLVRMYRGMVQYPKGPARNGEIGKFKSEPSRCFMATFCAIHFLASTENGKIGKEGVGLRHWVFGHKDCSANKTNGHIEGTVIKRHAKMLNGCCMPHSRNCIQ